MEEQKNYEPEILRDRVVVVPCDTLIANGPSKRPEGMSFVRFWKNRRNAQMALKKRLREGPNAAMLVDPLTMSVVTERQLEYDEWDWA